MPSTTLDRSDHHDRDHGRRRAACTPPPASSSVSRAARARASPRSPGRSPRRSRPPGTTYCSPSSRVTPPVGKEVRRIVLDPATGALSDRTEVLLYAADKAEHVDTVVQPALDRGEVVITDRYVDSHARLPGRRAHAGGRRGRARRPLGDPRPASASDRRARPRPGARLRPVRRARPDRGGVAGVPRPGPQPRSSTWPPPTPTTTSCSTRGARPTRSRPRCGSGSSPCSGRRRDDDDRHRSQRLGLPRRAAPCRSRRCARPRRVTG